MSKLVIVVSSGVVTELHTDMPGLEVEVLDMDGLADQLSDTEAQKMLEFKTKDLSSIY